MLEVIVILALLFVAFVALGVYVSVKAIGAAKRGVDRTISQAKRTVEDTTLRARSLGQTGVAGELAQLRVRLRTSMKATQDALHAGVAEDASLKESIGLFEQLSAHGHELDGQLRRLEREPDRSRVAQRLPELRERVERIAQSADSLRWAARDRARAFAAEDLEALSAQIDVEAGALRDWSRAEPDWSAVDMPDLAPAGPDTPAPEQGAARRRETADPKAGTAEPGADGARPPQALTERDPRQQPYSWQKAPRPEATN
ncbi:hypothetical protein ABZ532_04485 [Streptomyces sp. NPDC019396]|uniref:hypothetical protein n=1 Tax=Streptomyces sp. NPDC019396 TaxID=3154687 RepID=UPI0033DB44AC